MKVGDLAEEQVTLWATQAGINIGEPKRDRTGWDLEFEFPPDVQHISTSLLDRRPPDLVCKVQVKGTRVRGKRSESIKLDNWERFAKSPQPCFYMILEYEEGPAPVAAFLVHVGKDWIEKVLHRLRKEASIAGTSRGKRKGGGKKRLKKLHEQSMSVSWSDADRLAELNGDTMAQAIRLAVGDPKAYAEKKIHWINTLGYGERNMQVSFSTAADADTYEQMADFALGIVEQLPVTGIQTRDLRFGIPLPRDDSPPIDGILSEFGPSSIGESTLVVSAADGLRNVSLCCATRTSMSVFPFLPKEHWKIRCTTPFISFTIRVSDSSMAFEFNTGDPSKPVSLGEFSDLAEVIAIFHQSKGDDIKISIELALWSEPVSLGGSTTAPTIEHGMLELCDAAGQAGLIASSFGLDRAHQVVPLDLLDYAKGLAVMHAVISPEAVEFTATCPMDERPEKSDTVALLIVPSVPVGNVILTVIAAITGDWRTEPDGQKILLSVTGHPRIMFKEAVLKANWTAWRNDILPGKMKAAGNLLEEAHGVDYVGIPTT